MDPTLMEIGGARDTLEQLEGVLRRAWVLVDSCKDRGCLYLLPMGCIFVRQLKQSEAEIADMLTLILMAAISRHNAITCTTKERRVNAREDEEWKKNIVAQIAAIQSFSFKQLLDEASKDITDKTDYEYFAKKWGHDQRFEVLGRKERESLFNERVISLRKTLKEKVKARQVAPIDSFSHWLEGNPSNVPLLVGELLDDGVPEDFIEDLIMSVGDSLPVEQFDKGNPINVPLLVGKLLDNGVPEDFIEGLIMSVGDSLPVEQLIEEYEKRNRLRLLKKILEHLVREGSQDVNVHSALGKIRIDTNDRPEHFLTTNLYYDLYVVGKHCEKRNPTLAVFLYWRGQCDDELIDVTNKKILFELQARYVVERADPQLWKRVLALENPHRRELIDQVASTVLPESKNSDQVSATVEAFINADHPHELIELLEKIVLQNSTFSGNPNLQYLLIHIAIKADRSRLMDYINRLDNFDGPAIGEIAIGKKLYEEAFHIFKKFNLNVQAVNVLLDHIRSFERAYQFASRVKEDVVWSQVAKAQHREGLLRGNFHD